MSFLVSLGSWVVGSVFLYIRALLDIIGSFWRLIKISFVDSFFPFEVHSVLAS